MASDLPVLALDRTRIRQVILNLLNNAARFTAAGAVRLTARCVAGEVAIRVSDTGPGIPAGELPHLFDEFYQVDRSLQRKHGGFGLGLAISKHFVEAHDGRISVESQVGVGSTFTFTLPLPDQYLPLSRLYVSSPLPLPPNPVRPTVLMVDPDPAVATLLDRQLEVYTVVQVDNPVQVEEAVTLHRPQAVVWNMPPHAPGTPLPALSVPVIQCSLPSQAWVAADLKVAACLGKPITAQRLLGEIERLGAVRNVLVIDDDRNFCQLIERMVAASGRTFHVRSVYSAEDGLAALRTQRMDLVLLDLIMPGMDGFQLLQALRQETPPIETPVVLLTATNVADTTLAARMSPIVIQPADGWHTMEVVRCLRAVLGTLGGMAQIV